MSEQRIANISYPISELGNYGTTIDQTSLFEIVVDDYGNGVYVNKKATLEMLGDHFISSYPIFNKLDELYNDRTVSSQDPQSGEITYDYDNYIYVSGNTYCTYLRSYDSATSYENLKSNQLVRKSQLDNYINNSGMTIEPIKNGMKCYQFVNWLSGKTSNDAWTSRTQTPRMTEKEVVPFILASKTTTSSLSKIAYKFANSDFYATKPIRIQRNSFMTIIGKVRIPESFSSKTDYSNVFIPDPSTTPYHSTDANLWAAVYCNTRKSIIAITELHNYKNDVAYFSMQIPVVKEQILRVIVPFRPQNEQKIDADGTVVDEKDIFRNIQVNSVCMFYYS